MTKKEQREIFSRNLRHYIEKSGKQQQDIADDLDVAKTTFNNWCTGVSVPDWGKVRDIADYFNIAPSYLTDDKANEPQLDVATIIESYILSQPKGEMIFNLKGIVDDMSEGQLKRLLSYANYLLKEGE